MSQHGNDCLHCQIVDAIGEWIDRQQSESVAPAEFIDDIAMAVGQMLMHMFDSPSRQAMALLRMTAGIRHYADEAVEITNRQESMQ